MGLDVDRLIPQPLQQDRPQDFELWPEHARAWMVYTLCRTQWRKQPVWTGGPMGGGALVWLWEGLDYVAVEILMRRYRIPESEQDEVFEQLQILEGATLEIRNAR